MKHTFLKYFALVILLTNCNSEPKTEEELIAFAKEIHDRVITLDTHCDINVANFTDSINYTQRLGNQVNLPLIKNLDLCRQ